MNKTLTIVVAIGTLGFGLAVPTSASPTSPSLAAAQPAAAAPVAAAEDGFTIDHLMPADADRQPAAPPKTEGIAGGFVYVPLNPWRVYDSRDPRTLGRYGGGEERYFTVAEDLNGNVILPPEAVAVTYNLTITDTAGSGYVALFPADINWPGNSSINWTGNGQTIANGGTVAIGFYTEAGQLSVLVGPNANVATHVVIDITGYYI